MGILNPRPEPQPHRTRQSTGLKQVALFGGTFSTPYERSEELESCSLSFEKRLRTETNVLGVEVTQRGGLRIR
jgi:hypothetical protein